MEIQDEPEKEKPLNQRYVKNKLGLRNFLFKKVRTRRQSHFLHLRQQQLLEAFDDTDDSSEIAVLLAVGEGADLMPHTTHYSTDDIWTHMP